MMQISLRQGQVQGQVGESTPRLKALLPARGWSRERNGAETGSTSEPLVTEGTAACPQEEEVREGISAGRAGGRGHPGRGHCPGHGLRARRAGDRVRLALLPLLSLPRPRLRRGCCPRAPSEASLQLLSSFPRTCLSSLAPALN